MVEIGSHVPIPITTAYIDDAAVTPGKLSFTLASNGFIFIPAWAYTDVIAGTWIVSQSSARILAATINNSSAANSDEVDINKVAMDAGTYTCLLLCNKTSNAGIIKIYAGAELLGSFDAYGAANDSIMTVTGSTIAASGLKTIKIKVDGKNASSSGYNAAVAAIVLLRTA